MRGVLLEITERCNMRCMHCCGSHTARGKDMTWETFKAACGLVDESDGCLGMCLGGGEPALHPLFWQMLGLAMAVTANSSESAGGPMCGLVTNGTVTETAIALARMAQAGLIHARLSLDQFHDRSLVDDRVVAAFTKPRRPDATDPNWYPRPKSDEHDYRDIGKQIIEVQNLGRAKRTGVATVNNVSSCICPGPNVKVNGDIRYCGCPKAPVIGNVHTEIMPGVLFDWHLDTPCYFKLEPDQLKAIRMYGREHKVNAA